MLRIPFMRLLPLALVIAGCSGGDGTVRVLAPAPTPTTLPTALPSPMPSPTAVPAPAPSAAPVPASPTPTLVSTPTPSPAPLFSADAGPDRLGEEDAVLSLSGRATLPPGRALAFVEWTQEAPLARRAQLPINRNEDQIAVRPPQVEGDTTLNFRYAAVDDLGARVSDTVRVRVRETLDNRLPVARAGDDLTLEGSQNLRLDGCASADPDGELVAFAWRDAAGLPLEGAGCAVTVALFQGAVERVESFELEVTDDQGARAHDQIRVRILPSADNRAPVLQRAEALPAVARPGEEALLQAEASDADGHLLRYRWTQIDGPFVILREAGSAEARFAAPDQAGPLSLRFRVEVSDGAASDSRELEVVVDTAPVSRAPSFEDCVVNLFQLGCPLAPLARVVNVGDPAACADDPFAPNCPLGLLVDTDPGVEACLLTPTLPTCSELLTTVLSPSYYIERLNVIDSAGSCTPRYFPQSPYPHFWGALHEHTAYSDGTLGTVPEDVFTRVREMGWDFAVTTDHSDNLAIPLPLPSEECLGPRFPECLLADPDNPSDSLIKWQATAEAATTFTSPAFAAMRGFEWTSDRFGHANVLFSANNLNAKAEPGYALDMGVFWAWFQYPALLGGGDDGLLVFNHPGREDAVHGGLESLGLGDPAYTFSHFRYVPGADYRVVGVEVFGKGSEYDQGGFGGSWFGTALDQGWFLAPAGSEDHHGLMWGDPGLPKTVLIARSRAPEDLQEAMLARRMYAVAQQHNDIRLDFSAADGAPMGSRLVRPAGSGERLRYRVRRDFGNAPAAADLVVELMSSEADNAETYRPLATRTGAEGEFDVAVPLQRAWYFLRVRQADGRIIAVSAPIWLQPGTAPLPDCPAL